MAGKGVVCMVMDPIAPLQTRQQLKALGFLDHEVTILSLLFRWKKLHAREISQQTSLTFDAVHYSLHALEKKGLIRRVSDNGEDMVTVCSDREFLEWIDEQKKRNEEVYDEAKRSIERYFAIIEEASWKPDVMYFEGKQGIIDIYEDMLETGKDIYCWTDIEKIYKTVGDYVDEFIKKRIAKNITTYAIMPTNAASSERAQENERRKSKFSEHLPIDGEIRIYGDKVAVITFQDEKPVGFVFKGKVVTSVFRAIFEDAWKRQSQ